MSEGGVDLSESTAWRWREWITVILLSVTTVVTAWAGFQASKWGGAMSISFSQASTARIEATRHEGVANRQLSIQVALFSQWTQRKGTGEEELARFLEERFPEPLATAFDAWLATKPLQNPHAPKSPFDMEEYALPSLDQARQADAQADKKYDEALESNQRSDNYTVLTVALAAVLFFAAIAGKVRTLRGQWALLALGIVGFLIATGLVLTFPKLL